MLKGMKKRSVSLLMSLVLVMSAIFTPGILAKGAEAESTDETLIRTVTFELGDTALSSENQNVLAGTVITDNILDGQSKSIMKIVEKNGSRWLEVTAPEDTEGNLGYPITPSWDAPTVYKSYTLESDFIMQDMNADYYLKLIPGNWGGIRPDVFCISKDGNIYARSSSDGTDKMAARTTWQVDEPFKLKMVLHIDTKSYDLYHTVGDTTTQLVNSEPLLDTSYTTGLAAMMLYQKAGVHGESSILTDNVKLSVSDTDGTVPVVNPNPGALMGDSSGVIGDPINYYVDPVSGLDSNTGKAPDNAFKTVQKVADLTAPGDTVYLMDGEHKADLGKDVLNIKKSGAFNQETNEPIYITYTAYEGHHPVLTSEQGWNIINIEASYIIIDGIEVAGNNQNLTLADGEAGYDYWETTTDSGGTVDYSNPIITRVNTNGIAITGRELRKAGMSIPHNVIIRNCEIHDCPAGGIATMETDLITIENNHVYNNAWYMMYAGSGISLLNSMDYSSDTQNYKNIIRGNIVHDNETKVKWEALRRYSDGNGIIIDLNKNTDLPGVNPYEGKTLVSDNVSYNNGGSGIHAFNSRFVDIINNTAYNNNQSPHLTYPQLFANTCDYVNLFNNIVYSRELRPGEEAKDYMMTNNGASNYVIYANNIYYGGGEPVIMGPGDVVADPEFLSLDPNDPGFLKVSADSPAIDQGTKTLASQNDITGASRPQGAGYDIGAYETSFTSANPLINNEIDIEAIYESMVFKPKTAEAVKGTPVIDGVIDEIWAATSVLNVNQYMGGLGTTVTSGATAETRVLWDEDNNLYVLFDVKDPVLSKKAAELHEQDSIEMFLDENNGKTLSHEEDDRQYRVNYMNEKSVGQKGNTDEFTSAATIKADGSGYIVEIKVPFKTILASPGMQIGFDAQVNDDCDGGGKRTSTATWCDPEGNGYSSNAKWGVITLKNSIEQPSEDDKAVQAVIDKISAIGVVGTESKAAIKAARDAYDKLTEPQKQKVGDNYNVLIKAEADYAKAIKDQEERNRAEADRKAIQNVISQIDAIGKVSLTADSKAKIDAARKAYNALTAEQKKRVTNYNKLGSAESSYATLNKNKLVKGKTYTIGSYRYKITSLRGKTVTVTGVTSKAKKKIKSISVKDTVKMNGTKFKVTAIGNSAFKNCRNVTKAAIGKNVKTIGKSAFYGCRKLKTVTIKSSKLNTVGKNALKGIQAKAKIKVPKSKVNKYKNLMKGKGQKSGVAIVRS
ncbi:sugar-binding protein [uncultured Robinsoniella sp.]|uniref:sugar-binding protein n=1 Tax=uncultured Robinsoniella sp. TaxID=904190 RepID=UPI00374E3A2F